MSRVDDLIEELCPEGVPFKYLGEVAGYSQLRIDSAELDERSFTGVDNLVSNKRGRIDASHTPNAVRLTRYDVGDVLIGNIRPYLKKIWFADSPGGCSGDVLAIRVNTQFDGRIDSRFFYYILSSDRFFKFVMDYAKGAKMPRGSKSDVLRYRIPIPPIKIQREIVRILDRFTQLEAELETELDLRRQQHHAYQTSCFDALQAKGVPLVSLRDLGQWFGGGTPSKSKPEYWTGGSIPWVSPKDMAVSTLIETQDHITDAAVRESATKLVPGGAVALVARSSILDHTLPVAFVPSPVALNQDMKAVVPADGISARYVFHALRAARSDMLRSVRRAGGSVASLDSKKLGDFRIPVPDEATQNEITRVLNSFDALVNDLSIGLPAELAARRKQYEYYRDKLLTFKELSS